MIPGYTSNHELSCPDFSLPIIIFVSSVQINLFQNHQYLHSLKSFLFECYCFEWGGNSVILFSSLLLSSSFCDVAELAIYILWYIDTLFLRMYQTVNLVTNNVFAISLINCVFLFCYSFSLSPTISKINQQIVICSVDFSLYIAPDCSLQQNTYFADLKKTLK